MSTTIDSKVLSKIKEFELLLAETLTTKSEIGNTWKTSKRFQVNGDRIYDIKKSNKEDLLTISKALFVEEGVLSRSLDMFGLKDDEREAYNTIQGYSIEDWKEDLKQRWAFINVHDAEQKYKMKLTELKALLSEEQKRELTLQKLIED